MQNFIVLGIIPGTNIETTFTFWLWFAGALLFAVSLPQLTLMLQFLYRLTLYVRLAWTIENWEISAEA